MHCKCFPHNIPFVSLRTLLNFPILENKILKPDFVFAPEAISSTMTNGKMEKDIHLQMRILFYI